MRLLMDFLSEHGLPVALTPLLYKRLHDSAIDALCENPYLLCDHTMMWISSWRTVWRWSLDCRC